MGHCDRLTITNLLNTSVGLFADRCALSYVDGIPLTFADLGRKTAAISAFLRSRGIDKGDRVAILAENCPNWGVSYLAVTSMGAVAVPILPEFHSEEVANILRHAECKAVFVSKKLAGKLGDGLPEHVGLVAFTDDFSLMPPGDVNELSNAIEARGTIASTPGACDEVEEDDIAVIIYTSGTTGQSKGVVLTHENLVWNARASAALVDISDDERMLSVLPLAHTYECTLGLLIPVLKGGAVYYLDKPPTASVLLPAMRKVRPTMMLVVPLVIEKVYRKSILPQLTKRALTRLMLKLPPTRKLLHRIAGRKLYKSFGGRLHFFGIGGALLAPDVELFLRDARFPYAIGYGLTETSPLIAGIRPVKQKYRSTGPALEGLEVRLDNPNPRTGEGEIVVRGPNVMLGYYKDPARTSEVLDQDGWFRTGDLAVRDNSGYLYIKGRLKNVIIGPSGENIYPEEIESVINEFDFVLESLVLQKGGQLIARVHLDYEALRGHFAELQRGTDEMQQLVADWLADFRNSVNARLNVFSRLKEIVEQLEPFEKTPTHKIKRYLYTS